MKKYIKKASALLGALSVIASQSAMAATYYGSYGSADMWKDVFYSEQARLYDGGKFTYGYTYTAWPGSKSDHYNGVMAALSYENTWDVAQVFGEDCMDLQFSSIESVNDYKDYFIDADRLLFPNDTAIWNGFLFVVVSGPKADIASQTVYYEYGSRETRTESVAQRSTSGTNGATGNDAYVYVFDIKDGKNYGEALVAKWDINHIVGSEKNPYAVFESVTVNDDYICLTLNNNKISTDNEYNYDRGLVILENNIKRGGSNPAPMRLDNSDETYRYGAKPIIEAYYKSEIKNTAMYDTAIIDGYYMIFPTADVNMTTKGDKTIDGEEKIVLVDLDKFAKTGKIEKLSLVVSDIYKEDNRTLYTAIDEILPLESGKSWHEIDSAKIEGILADGTELSFLVSYQETANGKTTYYKHIFVTDWSDPVRPKAVKDFKYVDEKNTELNCQFGIDNSLFYYEGYYYVPSKYGVDVIKRYDENGRIDMSFVTTHTYANSDTEKDWNTTKKVDVLVSGNYMMAWNNYNGNSGYEIRLRLSDDKSEIVEYGGYGTRNRSRDINDGNDIIRYKDKVYLMSTGNLYATMNPCINVIDLSYATPISVEIDPIPKDISLPYTISGSCSGVSKAAVYIDNTFAEYVDTQKQADGTYKWNYTLTKAGNHTVKAVGVAFDETEIAQTAAYAEYTGISAEEISLSGTYSANADKLLTDVTIRNLGSADITGRLIVGIYKDNVLYSLGISEDITVKSGSVANVNDIDTVLPSYISGYTVKAFLTSGFGGFAPYATAAELTAN